MSFLSFLSSHRLHSTQRPWIDPLPVQLDLLLHALPENTPEAPDLAPAGPAGELVVADDTIVPEPPGAA